MNSWWFCIVVWGNNDLHLPCIVSCVLLVIEENILGPLSSYFVFFNKIFWFLVGKTLGQSLQWYQQENLLLEHDPWTFSFHGTDKSTWQSFLPSIRSKDLCVANLLEPSNKGFLLFGPTHLWSFDDWTALIDTSIKFVVKTITLWKYYTFHYRKVLFMPNSADSKCISFNGRTYKNGPSHIPFILNFATVDK
jgi:hypothetical protein